MAKHRYLFEKMEKMTVFFRAESPLLTDYCRYLFPPEGNDPLCVVKSTHEFGALLISHVRESERPPKVPCGDYVLELRLPNCDATQSLVNKFLYYSEGDQKRLNIALAAILDIDLKAFYLKAEGLGFSKKEIIETFIISRKLATCDPFDALHKRIYRSEQAKMRSVTKKLLRKVYYMFETLEIPKIEL